MEQRCRPFTHLPCALVGLLLAVAALVSAGQLEARFVGSDAGLPGQVERAQEQDPLPIGQDLSPAEIRRMFEMVETRPAANPQFAVRSLVPRDWKRGELELMRERVGTRRLIPLAAFEGPQTGVAPVIFHVQSARLQREITAAHWIEQYSRQSSLERVALRELSSAFADSLVRQVIEGEPFLVRLAARIDGDRIFVLMGLAHTDDYEPWARIFGVMVASFDVLTPSSRSTIEARRTTSVLDVVEFDYPESWKTTPVPGSDTTRAAISLFGHDPANNPIGRIRVEVDRRPGVEDPEEDLQHVLQHWRGRGIVLEEGWTELRVDRDGGPVTPRLARTYKGRFKNSPVVHELWILLMDAGDSRVRASLETIARQEDFQPWALSQRAFRIVLTTLRPPGWKPKVPPRSSGTPQRFRGSGIQPAEFGRVTSHLFNPPPRPSR